MRAGGRPPMGRGRKRRLQPTPRAREFLSSGHHSQGGALAAPMRGARRTAGRSRGTSSALRSCGSPPPGLRSRLRFGGRNHGGRPLPRRPVPGSCGVPRNPAQCLDMARFGLDPGALVPVDPVRSRAMARARKFGRNALISPDSDSDDSTIVGKAASGWIPGFSPREGPRSRPVTTIDSRLTPTARYCEVRGDKSDSLLGPSHWNHSRTAKTAGLTLPAGLAGSKRQPPAAPVSRGEATGEDRNSQADAVRAPSTVLRTVLLPRFAGAKQRSKARPRSPPMRSGGGDPAIPGLFDPGDGGGGALGVARARKFGRIGLISLDSDSGDGAVVEKVASSWIPGFSQREGPRSRPANTINSCLTPAARHPEARGDKSDSFLGSTHWNHLCAAKTAGLTLRMRLASSKTHPRAAPLSKGEDITEDGNKATFGHSDRFWRPTLWNRLFGAKIDSLPVGSRGAHKLEGSWRSGRLNSSCSSGLALAPPCEPRQEERRTWTD
jgi:hypothetical protein